MRRIKSHLLLMAVTIGLVAGIAISASCTSDENLKISESTPYANLLAELADYTSDFSTSHAVESRKDLGFGDFIQSVKADHCGFSGGKWIVSIGQSRKKWQDLKKEEQEQVKIDTVSVQMMAVLNIQIDSLISVYKADNSNVGALHNLSILKSFIEGDMDFNTTEELVYSILRSVGNIGIQMSEIDVAKTVAEIDDFFENIYDDDVTIMYGRLSQRYPNREEEFNVQCKYLTSIEKLYSVDEVNKFTEGYIKIINKSDISNIEKKRLTANLTIAPASCQLWTLIDSFYCK